MPNSLAHDCHLEAEATHYFVKVTTNNNYKIKKGTPFAGGIFRMRLVLGKDFPAVPPKGYFLTKIFHPNVGHKGEICVNVLKRDWKAELGLRHILLTIKCLLIHPNPESALNEEAGRLLLEDYAEYESRARKKQKPSTRQKYCCLC
uniref:Ubiquitin-conjugating enzyme E2S n=1 Tax=Oryzias sinensis TaxID=183150 RepID=A0A8C7X0K8_9TELE